MMLIDVSLVRDLIQTQFPQWADLSIRPVGCGGWDNRTFRLGELRSVRLPSAERYSPQVAKEHLWLPQLASSLPLAIPVPRAMGAPAHNYPWYWSIYRWIEGHTASIERIDDLNELAKSLAEFLRALQRIDSGSGPPPGPHNFFRGGSLSVYDAETQDAIASLHGRIDSASATRVWCDALSSTWNGTPVWVHGDIAASNLLVRDGRLSAVIDFGCLGVGDPACDLTIAWTLLSSESRETFREVLHFDNATWARGRGWALWKALIVLAESIDTNSVAADVAGHTLNEVLADD